MATAGQFFVLVLEKNRFFNAIWITYCMFLEPFEVIKFKKFESQLKKANGLVFHLH